MKQPTLKGEVFLKLIEKIEAKDKFGTNKMVSDPTRDIRDRLEKELPLDIAGNTEWINNNYSEDEIKNLKNSDNLMGGTLYDNTMTLASLMRPDELVNEALEFLIKEGFVRFWKNQITENSYFKNYGLTKKGWAISNQYKELYK